ncbi:oxidoreductase [Trypanosoma rangeli]|uniref:Oxidoreductase n=1 Tax=Trypanosoma rangeli TaxID=5698 RepID=A0A422NKE0_TRYRA|nr:oxidoreductase [Trypanosoma rangeli]RNF05962.1 oxidoreductase [Trypanosoma rangeli]|eukprot:RNF05962.1 oxidoreductase [Trypanosoma rangeli]
MALPASCARIVATGLSSDFRKVAEILSAPLPAAVRPTEIFVKNLFVGINASDINFTAGRYRPDAKPPFECGFEALGEVLATGEKVKGFTVGDVVVTQAYGAFAEYQVVSSRQAKKVPSRKKEWLPLDLSGTTASISLEEIAKPLPGEVAIVTAASGGTGQFAVQLLKKVYHCRVIGVTSSVAKEIFLKELGCDCVIVQERETIAEGIKRISPTGVNLAYESVGGETFESIVQNLSLRGRILSIGGISGYSDGSTWMKRSSTDTPLQTRLLSKSATLHTFFLPHYSKYASRHFATLCDLYSSGIIKSCIDPFVFKGLRSVPDAIDYMYSRKNQGKIVVEL